tara:strand:+ start:1199 stop:1687 length:489 start_codon:yes stop_codon:yes gene_type:complete
MLTEEYLKDNFITAAFIDSERKNIEILTTSEDKKTVFSTIIPFEEDNHMFKALMTVINIDQLHEATYQKKKTEKESMEKIAIDLAKKQGLIFDYEQVDTKFFPYMVKAMFNEQKNTDHLFALKLAFFEIPTIRDSKNTDARKELRTSQNKLDVIRAALDCVK